MDAGSWSPRCSSNVRSGRPACELCRPVSPTRFHRVIRSYALLPAWAIKPATLALPIVELGLAVALLGGWGST
ncbi:MAG: MauE/DoxX family redox-associated membrane protein, partial [Candidatus Limnocylindria bacterium]